MTTLPKFIQIHTLTSWAGALLNRDENGMGKRLPYGGAVRGRVSSQCKKRHWRTADDARSIRSLGEDIGAAGVRSREIVERMIREPLLEGNDPEVVDAVCTAIVEKVYGESGGTDVSKRQALILGPVEIDWLISEGRSIIEGAGDPKQAIAAAKAWAKDKNRNIGALVGNSTLPSGLDAALFGRMVTADRRANMDAAVMVNHSITVHGEQSELDYFSVVDDLTPSAAGVFDAEINSGLYYGYVVIDVAQLVANTTGVRTSEWTGEVDRDLAARVAENLIHLIGTITPGAKKGSTAPFSFASMMLVEAGQRQPTTLDGAFMDPLQLTDRSGLPIGRRAVDALADRMSSFDEMYGDVPVRMSASARGFEIAGVERRPIPDLGAWVAEIIRNAEA
jgi:CRISPR system Cascade subunit CasC